MVRHVPLPSFLSAKRSKVITAAAAGTLTLAAAVSTVSTAAVTVPESASPASASPASAEAGAAFMTTTGRHADEPAARQATAKDIQMIFGSRARAFQLERVAQASAAQAAAKAAARKAAARKAAATRAAQPAHQARPVHQAQPVHRATVTASSGSPQQIAEHMLSQYGWPASQFSCLRPLWVRESGWSVTAENPGSGAYGIPQALPGSKMASAGANWRTDAATQIRWGLTYIKDSYGSPCGAWAHEQADGWY